MCTFFLLFYLLNVKQKFTDAEGLIKYWDIRTGECLRTIKESNQILGCGVSPLQSIFVTTSDTAKISMYDLETGNLIRTFEKRYNSYYLYINYKVLLIKSTDYFMK